MKPLTENSDIVSASDDTSGYSQNVHLHLSHRKCQSDFRGCIDGIDLFGEVSPRRTDQYFSAHLFEKSGYAEH